MKNIIILIFVFSSIRLFGQGKQNLNFVLLINDKIPEYGIFEGRFQIIDIVGQIVNQFPFDYHVGRLAFNLEDYKKLFSQPLKSRVLIKFLFKNPDLNYAESSYEGELPIDKMNEEFLICHIYDFSKRENKLKYVFDHKKYLFQITMPAWSIVLKTWNKSTPDKVRLNQH